MNLQFTLFLSHSFFLLLNLLDSNPELLSCGSHWSLIHDSIWLSDSWHPLPVPHPDSWSPWSSWYSPRTVITVSCPVIGAGIPQQLFRSSKHGKTGNVKSYFPIFLSFLGKWRTAGDLSLPWYGITQALMRIRDQGILVSAGENMMQVKIEQGLYFSSY